MSAYISSYTLTSALGIGLPAMRASISTDQGGLVAAEWPDCDVPCFLGPVALPGDLDLPLHRESRNNRLVALALQQDLFADHAAAAVARYGAERVGLVMGTSTSSIDRAEAAYRHLDADDHFPEDYQQAQIHNPHAPGDYLAELLGLAGPRITVSVACASSAKVFATAQRWLQQELVDAVIVGGADSLCLSVIYGFNSLQLVAPEPCKPFAPDRQGISLGEAAGFALLTRDPGTALDGLALLGAGESCDAYHMSSAHPEGLGARLAMKRALASADIAVEAIDYLNLHGTGTRANDETEGRVCAELLTTQTVASATKGWTGHTLGAAGIVESIFCFEALRHGVLPGTRNTTHSDTGINLLLDTEQRSIRTAMTNSFGFGGNNCSLVFARA